MSNKLDKLSLGEPTIGHSVQQPWPDKKGYLSWKSHTLIWHNVSSKKTKYKNLSNTKVCLSSESHTSGKIVSILNAISNTAAILAAILNAAAIL